LLASNLYLRTAAAFLLLCVFFYSLLVWNQVLPTHDGLFHFRIAEQMIAQRSFVVPISNLPFTVLGENGVDHQWGWHLLIAPFTLLGDEVGLNLSIAAMAALVFAICYLVFSHYQLPMAFALALLACFYGFDLPDRFLMLRTQNLNLVCLLLAFVCLDRRRYFLLALIVFLMFQSYHGSTLLLVLIAVYVAVQWGLSRQLNLRPVIFSAIALLLALRLNPWYPENIEYLLFHVLYKQFIAKSVIVSGVEWARPGVEQILINGLPYFAGLALFVSRFAEFVKQPRRLALLVFCSLLFVLYLSASRFAEYLVPCSIFMLGLNLQGCGLSEKLQRLWSAGLLCVALFFVGHHVWYFKNLSLDSTQGYREVAEYLREHDDGSMVFNFFWTHFVNLYWHYPAVRAANGLDGSYLLYADPERYAAWEAIYNISQRPMENPSRLIQGVFGARWIALSRSQDRDSQTLIYLLERDSCAVPVVVNEGEILYEILCPPQAAPDRDM
jgi:hypothetical protein